TFQLPAGDCPVTAVTEGFPLTLAASGGKTRFSGFITGKGSVRIEPAGDQPLEISGSSSNSYQGATALTRGVLKLSKPANATAMPGQLTLGGSEADADVTLVIWGGDGQLAPTSVVAVEGNHPAILDLNGHQASFHKLVLSKTGVIRTGNEG